MRSSSCLEKNRLCLQKSSCIHVDLIQHHFFFQVIDSIQFLSTFQSLSNISNHVKNKIDFWLLLTEYWIVWYIDSVIVWIHTYRTKTNPSGIKSTAYACSISSHFPTYSDWCFLDIRNEFYYFLVIFKARLPEAFFLECGTMPTVWLYLNEFIRSLEE